MKLRWILGFVSAQIVVGAAVAACGARSELYVGQPPDGDGGGGSLPDAAVHDSAVHDAIHDAVTEDALILPEAGDASMCPPGTVTAYLVTQGGGTGQLFTFDPATLATAPVGVFQCPTDAQAWTLTAASSGLLYVMTTPDWKIYVVNPATLECADTGYAPGQLSFGIETAFTVAPGPGAERLFVAGFGQQGATLASTDLQSFVLSEVGPLGLPPNVWPLDIRADAFGRLYGYTRTGEFFLIDPATGATSAPVQTGFGNGGNWALLTWNEDVYLFAGNAVARYDVTSNTLIQIGTIEGNVVGASAAPCVH